MSIGEPAWALATRFPLQGDWTDEDYFELDDARGRVELRDGVIEVLPMGTHRHQVVLRALLLVLYGFSRRVGGEALPAGIRVRLRPGLFREPDVAFMTAANRARIQERYWEGADLVVEVLSGGPDDLVRDRVRKRAEYAEAGVPEYWIADPDDETITVLRLERQAYVDHGTFRRGEAFDSPTYAGLRVEVNEVFADLDRAP